MRNYDDQRNIEATGGDNPAVGSFVCDKFISVSPSTNLDLIKLTVPPMRRRRVFCYIEARLTSSTADFYVLTEVEFRKNGQTRCVLPANIGRDANPNYLKQELVSLFPNPTAGANTSLVVTFSTEFASGTDSGGSAVLTPCEVDVTADECILRIKGLAEKGTTNLPDVRAWLGVLSLNP